MMHKIILMNKKEVEVTQSELETILNSEDLVLVPRIGMSINKKSIVFTEPIERSADKKFLLENRKK